MSAFLTFTRRTGNTFARNTTVLSTARPFSIIAPRQASGETKGKPADSDHTTRKDDRLDVQTDNSVAARE
jgi:hypothetical protein